MNDVKVNALMLRAVDYLEYDKILTLLTAEHGKLTVGIKGVRKAGAKLKFAAQPFCFAEYILAGRGERYTVTQASECESFYDLRCDINKFYAACTVCETAAALTYEGDGSGEIFSICVKALTDMCNGDEGLALIRFLLASLRLAGYGINNERCAECGAALSVEENMRFDMDTGAFTCWGCGTGAGVSGVTYAALCAAEGRSGEEVTADGKKRALRLLREYLAYKTDAECRSLSEYIALI